MTAPLAQVRGVLDDAEAAAAREGGWLRGTHVVVGTPQALAAAAAQPGGAPLWADAHAVAVDEADACLQAGLLSLLAPCVGRSWASMQGRVIGRI